MDIFSINYFTMFIHRSVTILYDILHEFWFITCALQWFSVFCLFLEWFVWYKNKQFRMFFYKIICGGISFCKPPYCSISHLEAREYFGLCGNKAFSETIMCVNFFWTASSCIIGELLLVVKDRALNATVYFEGQWLHIQKDAQFRGASAGVSLEEIQRRFFLRNMHFALLVFGTETKRFPWFCLSHHVQYCHKPWMVSLSHHIWKCWDIISWY